MISPAAAECHENNKIQIAGTYIPCIHFWFAGENIFRRENIKFYPSVA